MSWVAAAIGGSALLGAYTSSQAAKSQRAGLDAGAQAQLEMFERQQQLQQPYRQAGNAAVNQLAQLLGLRGYNSGTPLDVEKKIAELAERGYDEGYRSGGASKQDIIAGALSNYKQGLYGNDEEALKRFGYVAPAQTEQPAEFGSLMKDFSQEDFQQDPGYAFRLSEGMKALDRSAAARGGLQSGAALKAASRYTQDMASQEYQNAFNRYQVNRQNKLQPLQFLTGVGQGSAGALTGAAGQLGQGLAGTYGSMGDVNASGQVGSANAIAGGIGQYLNYQQGQNYLDVLRKQGGARPSTYQG